VAPGIRLLTPYYGNSDAQAECNAAYTDPGSHPDPRGPPRRDRDAALL